MASSLLTTKIHIPTLRSNLVNRLQLVERLDDGISQGKRLTLICAPAGYGKSTLLVEWITRVGIPAAWLSLEKSENSPALFWEYFRSALASIPALRERNIGQALVQGFQSPKSPDMEEILSTLVNDLSQVHDPMLLVLDDLQLITDQRIHQGLVFLIDHLPLSSGGLHIAVASRMDPPWPLARWRAREELNELRPNDLRFSHHEATQLLNQNLLLGLSTPNISALLERTEGWIAGLQLAAISIQGHIKTQGSLGAAQFIENFTGSNRFVLDYLMEEVISQLPEDVRDFLYRTSILEHLNARLCDAVLIRSDSQAILDRIEQANLFLMPLDDERQWYRYHHLFSDLLLKHLKQEYLDQIPVLHQRACDWYAENNFLSEAISHALDAGDSLRVNELVAGNALTMVEHAELFDVLRHFEQMPKGFIESKPWLEVAHAWVKAYADPSIALEGTLEHIEQGLPEIKNLTEQQRLTSQLIAIRAYVAWVLGEAEKALEFTQQALQILPPDDGVTRAHVLNIEGLALEYIGETNKAIKSHEAAILTGQKAGKPYAAYFAYACIAFDHIILGRLHKAYDLCQCVLSEAGRSPQDSFRMPVLAYGYSTRSLVELEWNDLDAALSSARQGVLLAEQWNQADTLHYTLTNLSRCLLATGDHTAAFAVNHRALQLGRDVSAWFYRISAGDEVEFNLINGDIPAAERRYSEIDIQAYITEKTWRIQVTRMALLYAQGKYPEILQSIRDCRAELEQFGQQWVLMNLLPIYALALSALGREDEALQAVRECIAYAVPEGFKRIFLNRGKPMQELLQLALNRGIETDYISQLLPAFSLRDEQKLTPMSTTGKRSFLTPGTTLVEPLSDRELQVLHLLDTRLTNEEIGGQLYVSVNTIRTHVRNIYSKLGVSRRGEAVRLARELKLI